MNSKTTLLMEIRHADSPEPLRLMCGHDFSELRKDSTGQEIYGTVHEGQEYLLFPMIFHTLENGVLAVRTPATGEDVFFKDRHGHRVIFKSPQGTPYFREMPEEYHSCTGTLRVDAEQNVFVELDRVTAG